MKHPEIDRDDIVEHYVAGKLMADEEARFEEHYLACPACIRAIEDTERLRRGLELVAAQDLASRKLAARTFLAAAVKALRSGPGTVLVSAALVIALVGTGLAWQRVGRLGVELDAARRELAEQLRPRINTTILTLVRTRAGEQPLQQISLAPEPEWIVLAVELGNTGEERYEATLIQAAGDVVWTAPGLLPTYRGTLTLSLHSSLLPPGQYVLSMSGEVERLRFPLQVVPSGP